MLPRLLQFARVCQALLWLLLLGLSPGALADSEADYRERLEQVQRNITQLQRELQRARSDRSELENALSESEQRIGELLKEIEATERDLRQQVEQLQELREERQQLNDARDHQRQQMGAEMRAAYQLGQQSQLALLLNQESPERVSRLLRYHDYFLADRRARISRFLATLDRLDQLEPEIAAATAALEDNRTRLQDRHRQLSQRQEERRQTLARLNASIADADRELAKQTADRQQLQSLLDEIGRTMAGAQLPGDDRPFGSLRGQLPWPTQGRVQHHFGSARAGGQMQWNGMYIRTDQGQTVVAVHRGRVVFSDYFRSHGLLVIVDHGDGYMSLYAHNQTLLKEPGEWVSAGEPIAHAGNTGGREQAGLYFEIRHQGTPTNPANWLGRA